MLKSLSFKMIASFITVTVLVVSITSALFLFLFSQYAYMEKKSTLQSCAENIAEFISQQDLLNIDYKSDSFPDFSNLMGGLIDSSIWIMKSDGLFIPLKSSKWPVSITQLSNEDKNVIDKALENRESFVTTKLSDNFKETTFTAIVPIYSQVTSLQTPEVLGVVFLNSPKEIVNPLFYSAKALLFVAVAMALCATIATATMLTLRITKPLKEVSEAATQLSKGNFSARITPPDTTELKELAYSLNHLAQNLDRTITNLYDEKQKLDNIINNISDGLAAFDTNMRLTKYNTALLKLCKDNQFEDPQVRDMILNVMQTGKLQTLILQGPEILKFKASRIKNNEIIEGAVVIVQDISQQERLEKLRNEFMANVSHEFRTPLSIIKGSAELLADDALDTEEDKHRYYDRIMTEATALEHLVRDLLDQSKLKAGRIELKIHLMNAEDLLEDIVEKMKPIAGNKNINLEFIPSGAPDVAGDYDRLRQISIIFIDNAIKFTPEGGTITVSTRFDDDYVYMSFKDTGMGIAEEDLPFVFERFYKVDKARGGSETGSGLGLSIAWQIADLHKGTITVDSVLGEGTTFTAIIPIWKD